MASTAEKNTSAAEIYARDVRLRDADAEIRKLLGKLNAYETVGSENHGFDVSMVKPYVEPNEAPMSPYYAALLNHDRQHGVKQYLPPIGSDLPVPSEGSGFLVPIYPLTDKNWCFHQNYIPVPATPSFESKLFGWDKNDPPIFDTLGGRRVASDPWTVPLSNAAPTIDPRQLTVGRPSPIDLHRQNFAAVMPPARSTQAAKMPEIPLRATNSRRWNPAIVAPPVISGDLQFVQASTPLVIPLRPIVPLPSRLTQQIPLRPSPPITSTPSAPQQRPLDYHAPTGGKRKASNPPAETPPVKRVASSPQRQDPAPTRIKDPRQRPKPPPGLHRDIPAQQMLHIPPRQPEIHLSQQSELYLPARQHLSSRQPESNSRASCPGCPATFPDAAAQSAHLTQNPYCTTERGVHMRALFYTHPNVVARVKAEAGEKEIMMIWQNYSQQLQQVHLSKKHIRS
ncbi:hypothetical protein C8R43DRAFT_993850 [Mycena crocata]|nr:hypothetical protein C8R43DRAFT_993850 [Mycena crocata]